MNTIQNEWLDFKDKVLPKDASPAQIADMETGFYAGAFIAFSLVNTISNSYSEEQGVALLDGIQTEIEAFLKSKIHKAP